MASVALRRFLSGEYGRCVESLEGVGAATLGPAPRRRLEFNLAVAEFHARPDWERFGRRLSPHDASDPYELYALAILAYRAERFHLAAELLERARGGEGLDAHDDAQLADLTALLLLEVLLRCRRVVAALRLADAFEPRTDGHAPLLGRLRARAHLMARLDVAEAGHEVLLRAHRLCAAGDAKGAARALRHANDAPPDALNNALAVVHAQLRKHHLCVEYARRALLEHARRPSLPRPTLLYNLGLALLRAGRLDEAFERLVEAVRHFPNDPSLWLRLAECCEACAPNRSPEPRPKAVGSKTLLDDARPRPRPPTADSYAIPAPSLEFAALCLTNASALLPDDAATPFRAGPQDPLDRPRYLQLQDSVRLLYAYVSLRLDDPATALDNCDRIAGSASASPARRALAQLYAAEALVGLDRTSEALERLNPLALQPHLAKVADPACKDAIGFAAWLDAAVCQTVRGDAASVRPVLHSVESPRALPLRLYLETCVGNADNCRALLRKLSTFNKTAI